MLPNAILAGALLLLPLQMPDVQAQIQAITREAKAKPAPVVAPPPTTRPATPAASHPHPVRPATPAGGVLACIRRYESGGNYRAVSPSGRYRGAYQFGLQTWRSVGGAGDPARASVAEQDRRALMLYRSRGLQPWPTPAKRCR